MNPSLRYLLAVIAAHGILGHNSAVPLPERFTMRELERLLPERLLPDCTFGQLESDLNVLTDLGLIAKYNTGHADYGNTYVEGPDVWYITAAGLVELWTSRW